VSRARERHGHRLGCLHDRVDERRPPRARGDHEGPEATQGLATLTTRLNTLTGGAWRTDLQSCGASSSQMVGSSGTARGSRSPVRLTRGAERRPDLIPDERLFWAAASGRYARAAAVGGGADFSVVAVHLDSGTEEKDWSRRRSAIDNMDAITIGTQLIFDIDQDVVVMGDFNSMGREEAPAVTRMPRSRSSRRSRPEYGG